MALFLKTLPTTDLNNLFVNLKFLMQFIKYFLYVHLSIIKIVIYVLFRILKIIFLRIQQ